MQTNQSEFSFAIALEPGEPLQLPPGVSEIVGPGKWLITVTPLPEHLEPVRSHSAFLSSYAPQDEGLYDDRVPR